MPNLPKNEHFLSSDTHTYAYASEGEKCSFSGKFGVLCFLETPVLRFAILLYYRRFLVWPFILPDGLQNLNRGYPCHIMPHGLGQYHEVQK